MVRYVACVLVGAALWGVLDYSWHRASGSVEMTKSMPPGLVEAIHTTPRTDNDQRALAIGMIPPSAWDAYVETLETDGRPARKIGASAWEVTMKDGTTWTAFGDVRTMPGGKPQ